MAAWLRIFLCVDRVWIYVTGSGWICVLVVLLPCLRLSLACREASDVLDVQLSSRFLASCDLGCSDSWKPTRYQFLRIPTLCACATIASKQWAFTYNESSVRTLLRWESFCLLLSGLFLTPIPSLPALRRNRFSWPICRCRLRDEVENLSPIFGCRRPGGWMVYLTLTCKSSIEWMDGRHDEILEMFLRMDNVRLCKVSFPHTYDTHAP